MSYVLQKASRGAGAIAARDDAPRGRVGLGANALKSTSLQSIVTAARVQSAPVIAKVASSAPVATVTDGRTRVTAPIALLNAAGIPTAVAAPLLPASTRATTLVAAPGTSLFQKPAPAPAPLPTPTQTTQAPPAASASVEPVDQGCPSGYILSGEKCVPAPTSTSCPTGYYLDSSGRCLPIQQANVPGVDGPTRDAYNLSTPIAEPVKGTPSGAPGPISYGGGGGAMYSSAAAAAQSAAAAETYGAPVGAPARGLPLGKILLFGGLGIGALYLLTRNRR